MIADVATIQELLVEHLPGGSQNLMFWIFIRNKILQMGGIEYEVII